MASVIGKLSSLELPAYFRGCYTMTSLAHAYTFHDPNNKNTYFIQLSNRWVLVYADSVTLVLCDPRGDSPNYPSELIEFLALFTLPYRTLPYTMCSDNVSVEFALFWAIMLCVYSFSITFVVKSFNLLPNSVYNNSKTFKYWLQTHYQSLRADTFHRAQLYLNFA